ncbi:PASTA domain-containing protein [Nocardia takedensis]
MTADERAAGSRAVSGRTAAVVAVVAALVGMFGAGTATGFWVSNSRIAHGPADPGRPDPESGPSAGESGVVAVPDVRGLTEETARGVLADSASAGSRVEIRSRAYAGLAGIVIEQEPAFGAAVAPRLVLTVSAPAAVPEVAGRTETELRTQLLELGAGVQVVRRYVPAAAPGTVLDVSPAVGSPLPDTLTLTVADSPSTAYLADVEASRDGCRSGSFTQAATKQDNALSCSVTKRPGVEPRGPMWEFAGAVEEIELGVGLPTDAEPAGAAHVELFADGRPVAAADIAYGATTKLSAATPGALQFMIVVTATNGAPERVTVTGTVRGSREAIIALTEKK